MFLACLTNAAFLLSETPYLVEWMKSLDLDLTNETRLAAVNPFEMMVRGSLDLGVEAVMAITFSETKFFEGKRQMQIDYSRQQDIWRDKQPSRRNYALFLTMYGAKHPLAQQIASKITEYERELEGITRATLGKRPFKIRVLLSDLGQYTEPYVISDEWVTLISRYTNHTYGSSDTIWKDFDVTTILVKLFENKSVGRHGLQYLVAWTFFRQLLEFTEPSLFLRGRRVSDACYRHVMKVMRLAVITPYFQQEPYPDAPLDHLFPTWIKALSFSAHEPWADQTYPLYDESAVNAVYYNHENLVIITTGMMHDPFLYPYGPLALNYGGLGMILAHEMTHAFDVAGIETIMRYGGMLRNTIMGDCLGRPR
ncbi:hypothetical protein MTO96_038390 [Rhipicephalus appendiculatus]